MVLVCFPRYQGFRTSYLGHLDNIGELSQAGYWYHIMIGFHLSAKKKKPLIHRISKHVISLGGSKSMDCGSPRAGPGKTGLTYKIVPCGGNHSNAATD